MGPVPQTPNDFAELLPTEGEDLCWLAGNWRILQRVDGHRGSIDDLLTAHCAVQLMDGKFPHRFLDLGCGIGTVLTWLAWAFPEAEAVGIEIQPVSVSLVRRTVRWNGFANRTEIRCGDIRHLHSYQGLQPFDLVTGTPPYFPIGDGPESRYVQRSPCRFEHRGGIEDYCMAAKDWLREGAPLVVCEAYLARHRVEPAAKAAGLAVVYWQDVIPKAGKAPLFSLIGMRHARHAPSQVTTPPLVVRDHAGNRTSEFIAIRQRMGMPP
jgi:tRNA1(Val) A37 N6-methylase TrmN6